MSRFIDAIKTIVTKNLFFTSLLLAGAFLRFYKLQEFTIFLSDQGRDALIVKDVYKRQELERVKLLLAERHRARFVNEHCVRYMSSESFASYKE